VGASQQFGIGNQTDVFVVANNGTMHVYWVQGGGTWQGPWRSEPTFGRPSGPVTPPPCRVGPPAM
jgi:hypothetical protein